MKKSEINPFNGNETIRYYNNQYRLHREDGPAYIVIGKDRKELLTYWYINGYCHNENGPARIFSDGTKEYYLDDWHYPNIKTDEELARFIKKMKWRKLLR